MLPIGKGHDYNREYLNSRQFAQDGRSQIHFVIIVLTVVRKQHLKSHKSSYDLQHDSNTVYGMYIIPYCIVHENCKSFWRDQGTCSQITQNSQKWKLRKLRSPDLPC